MSSVEERKENNLKVDFIIDHAAGCDKDAIEYLTLLAQAVRIIDDVYDEVETVTQDQLLTVIEVLFIRIPSNKFYREHQDLLFSQHISMWNAWEISNVLYLGDNLDKLYAHVLRDYINEILPVVALITQGHAKMKEINSLIRPLFKKELEK
jgi:hypothetical protein